MTIQEAIKKSRKDNIVTCVSLTNAGNYEVTNLGLSEELPWDGPRQNWEIYTPEQENHYQKTAFLNQQAVERGLEWVDSQTKTLIGVYFD